MRKIVLLLPFALLALGGCFKSTSDQSVSIAVPVGTFSGQFRKIHVSSKTGKLDTAKAALTLVMSKDSGYRVTADTTTIHAGSKGGFQIQTSYINFIDSTYPKTGTPAKTHLAGAYAYYFDGTVFQMTNVSSAGDTLFYQYDLKRSN